MKIEDEINQINEIISELDVIQDDEWQRKEGETEEEYNKRLEDIEEDIEEELLDYISDSLLVEQEINEEEAIKEAQEKIKSDYELFSDAFIKDENGTIALKSVEELQSLGYDTPEEIEKFKEIQEHINAPEVYIDKIKASIQASKDIDAEIDRKMELAKSIISAKKRGETIPSSLNPSLEKDKFEKANEYITNTTTLRKIPIIQSEYINNNYIAKRRYNNVIRNNINNTSNRNNSSNRATTEATFSQTVTPVVSTIVPQIVTKKIPERKNTIYTNFEKKLDKNNDLTKQKIKARTELKSIFKEIEDTELSKEELEELNLKIESIRKKYPNAITDKTLNKLYDTFRVKLPTVKIEQQHNNTEHENDSKLEELQQKIAESVSSIGMVENEHQKAGIKIETPTLTIKPKATDIALGAFALGGAIGATIGTIKQKSGKKIEQLKQKGEEVIENIAQQQKKTRKTTITPKNEVKCKKDKTRTQVSTQTTVETKTVIPKVKMTKEELMETLKKAEKFDTKTLHSKGMDLLVINKLICYLKVNNDPEIQIKLDQEISKLQNDRMANGDLYIYNYTNPHTLNYLYESYRDGVKSADGSRELIKADPNAASYYLYLTYNNLSKFHEKKSNAQQKLNHDIENGYTVFVEGDKKDLKRLEEIEKFWNLEDSFIKKIEEDFDAHKQETCFRYFEFVKEKYQIDKLKGIERLKVEPAFISELRQGKQMSFNTEYLDLAIYKELVPRQLNDSDEEILKSQVQAIEAKMENGENLDSKSLRLLGDMYYSGLKNASNEDVVLPDKRKAIQIYEQLINKKGIDINLDICNNLIDTYSDNTTPFYDKSKADRLQELVAQKGLQLKSKFSKAEDKEASTYVCSDLHGQYPAYRTIVSQLKEKDKLYILGDVIDRGPDGIKILQDVMKRKQGGQVEFLIGNHELMMIKSLFLNDENESKIWTSDSNQGQVTRESFERLSPAEQNSIKEFLLDSYVYKNIKVDSQNVHLVHAKSIQDRNDNSDKTVREMLTEGKEQMMINAVWSRADNCLLTAEPHPESSKQGSFTVIGHSPTDNNMIKYKNGYIDIDCGAGQGAVASLVNLTKGIVNYFNVDRERKKENNKQQEK